VRDDCKDWQGRVENKSIMFAQEKMFQGVYQGHTAKTRPCRYIMCLVHVPVYVYLSFALVT